MHANCHALASTRRHTAEIKVLQLWQQLEDFHQSGHRRWPKLVVWREAAVELAQPFVAFLTQEHCVVTVEIEALHFLQLRKSRRKRRQAFRSQAISCECQQCTSCSGYELEVHSRNSGAAVSTA